MGRARAAARYGLVLAAVAAGYYVAAQAGLRLALVDGQVTPMWPPTGIALVALMLLGPRVVPAVFAGAFLVNLPLGPSVPGAIFIAAGNTLAPVVACHLLRAAGFRAALHRLRDVVALVFLGALAGMAVSATVGALTLLWLGGLPASRFWPTWSVWWTGDAMGVLIVAPLLLSARRLRRASWPTRAGVLEAAAVIAGAVAVTALMVTSALPLLYMVFPFIIWASWRFQIAGAAPVVAISTVGAVIAVATGRGPFPDDSLLATMLTLQAFNATCVLTGLMLAAMTSERNQARASLADAAAEQEALVRERTGELHETIARLQRSEALLADAQAVAHIGSWEWDIRANVVTWSEELFRLFGLEPGSISVDFAAFLTRVHPQDREHVQETVQRAYADHEPFLFDHRVVWPDGSVHWLHGRGRVLVGADGQAISMSGTGQDIDERVAAEEDAQRLRDAELRRRQALELNDEVVQGLSVAKYALDSGDVASLTGAIDGTLAATRNLVGELLGDEELPPGEGLVRERPAQVRWRSAG